MKRSLIMVFTLFMILINSSNIAEAAVDKAAFIRKDGLWMKENEVERRIVEGSKFSYPSFSNNGTYISYISGESNELWVYNRVTRIKKKVFDGQVKMPRWSPVESKLAWKSENMLNVIDLEQPASSFENVTLGADSYSWTPDGKGFIVSASAKLEPDGWSAVRIFSVPADAKGELKKVKVITTLPKMSESFFAVGTTEFKWGKDGGLFAFIACPTASISADTNTLMVVSKDGSKKKMIGKMLNHPNWFQWSPNTKGLGFIKGIGRLESENKRLTVWDSTSGREVNLGFDGYADGDFTWRNEGEIVVSRQIEWGWDVPEEKRSKPFLVQVKVADGSAKKLTKPGAGEADVYPKTLPGGDVVWVRTGDNNLSKVMRKSHSDQKETVWIDGLYKPEEFSSWASVMDLYQAR